MDIITSVAAISEKKVVAFFPAEGLNKLLHYGEVLPNIQNSMFVALRQFAKQICGEAEESCADMGIILDSNAMVELAMAMYSFKEECLLSYRKSLDTVIKSGHDTVLLNVSLDRLAGEIIDAVEHILLHRPVIPPVTLALQRHVIKIGST